MYLLPFPGCRKQSDSWLHSCVWSAAPIFSPSPRPHARKLAAAALCFLIGVCAVRRLARKAELSHAGTARRKFNINPPEILCGAAGLPWWTNWYISMNNKPGTSTPVGQYSHFLILHYEKHNHTYLRVRARFFRLQRSSQIPWSFRGFGPLGAL